MSIKVTLKALHQTPIAFYPCHAKIMGSVSGGVLLSQLLYWYGKVKGSTFYKADAELRNETMLNEWEFRKAKARLKELPFLTVTRKGVPPVTHYTIDEGKYAEMLQINFETVSELNERQSPNQTRDSLQNIYKEAETTSETTTEKEEALFEDFQLREEEQDDIMDATMPTAPVDHFSGPCHLQDYLSNFPCLHVQAVLTGIEPMLGYKPRPHEALFDAAHRYSLFDLLKITERFCAKHSDRETWILGSIFSGKTLDARIAALQASPATSHDPNDLRRYDKPRSYQTWKDEQPIPEHLRVPQEQVSELVNDLGNKLGWDFEDD